MRSLAAFLFAAALHAQHVPFVILERDPDAIDLLERNRLRFGIANLHIHAGEAPEGLARLLDSLTRLDPPSLPVRVVVIDNSPVPSSAPVVESVADRLRIEWFHEPRTGISFARNAALDRLGGLPTSVISTQSN